LTRSSFGPAFLVAEPGSDAGAERLDAAAVFALTSIVPKEPIMENTVPGRLGPRKTKSGIQEMEEEMKKRKNDTPQRGESPSRLIDARIKELSDWRGKTLSKIRCLIQEADPGVTEEWKWRGVPAWSHAGMICTGETYKNVVKMTFAKGASLQDPSGLFNSSLEGNTRRAIDFHQGDKIDENALKALIRDAVALNTSPARTPRGRARDAV
jgi:hypothetical protein